VVGAEGDDCVDHPTSGSAKWDGGYYRGLDTGA
jgi:hypothetical protein